jgi:hypothetical protein
MSNAMTKSGYGSQMNARPTDNDWPDIEKSRAAIMLKGRQRGD